MREIALILCCLLAKQAAYCEELLDASKGWKVRAEERQDGRKNGWARPDFDDSAWEISDLSREAGPADSGAAGATWYRKWMERPEAWPRTFLVLSGLRGRAEAFINGTRIQQDLVRHHQGTLQIIREISALAGQADRFQVSLRVSAGIGGEKPGFDCLGGAPVMLARDVRGLFVDRLGWFDYLAQEYGDLPWPSWAREEGISWFPIVSPDGQRGALMGMAGQLEPEGGDFAVSVWLYYPAGKRFYPLEKASGAFTLEGRYLPLPLFKAKVGKWFQVYVRSWLHSSSEDPSLKFGVGQVTVENTLDRTREINLLIAIHPFGCRFPPHEIEEISFDSKTRTVFVNGRPAIILAGEPDSFGGTPFSDTGETTARLAAESRLPNVTEIRDPKERLASALAVYRLQIQPFGSRTQTFRFVLKADAGEPDDDLLNRIRSINWKNSWKEAVGAWENIMSGPGKTIIRLPDSAAQNAFYASVAYVRMALVGKDLPEMEGNLAAAALLRAGHEDALRQLKIDPSPAWRPFGEGVVSIPGLEYASSGGTSPGHESMGFFWPGRALTGAWRMMVEGKNDEAGAVLDWWLDRQTFPGTFIWAEAVDPATGKYGGGEIPDIKAAAGCVCLLRDMLLQEQDGALMLASGVPAKWFDPGRRLQIRHAPTEFGVVPGFSVISSPRELVMRMYSFEQLARLERRPTPAGSVRATPPAGYRWKIPGSRAIGKVLIDGKALGEIPEGRTLILPEIFRTVRVIW